MNTAIVWVVYVITASGQPQPSDNQAAFTSQPVCQAYVNTQWTSHKNYVCWPKGWERK